MFPKKTNNISELKNIAKRIRKDVLEMTFRAGANGGHLGGAFSCADILAVLYGGVMNLSPSSTNDVNRDRFILSKGHCAIGHYAALKETGFISEEELLSFEQPESSFPTHETMNQSRGIEISGGSLGYGLSIGVGLALNAKRKALNYKVYVLMGDGECNEGTIWEAAMSAARFNLVNLAAIVDVNKQSLDGYTSDIMPIHDMKKVWEGFGWHVIEVDGNNIAELIKGFNDLSSNNPNVLIAHTIKCKGLPSIEGQVGWHHARITQEQFDAFSKELEESVLVEPHPKAHPYET